MKARCSLLFAAVLLASSAHAQVLPNEIIVGGKTIGEWTADCWKWIYSIPTNDNPQVHCDGRLMSNRQPSETVFFIPPPNGVSDPCTRTFSVPEGKFILLPVLGLTYDNIDTVPPFSIDEMHDILNAVLDEPAELAASVDGVAVPNLKDHRASSPPFSFDFVDGDNPLTLFYPHPIVGLDDPIVADGDWLMLEPLSPGPHVLHARGQISIPIFLPHDITCNITVIAVPLAGRVQKLIETITSSAEAQNREQPLLAILNAAKASFNAKNLQPGINQLPGLSEESPGSGSAK